jgi:hypothetical protein|tara:strand:- start:3823 stop:3951 length:129 start_codon:yes stop_codon:yes gene_type:complete
MADNHEYSSPQEHMAAMEKKLIDFFAEEINDELEFIKQNTIN